MRPHAVSKAALAAATWRRLFQFFVSTRSQRDETLGRLGLTPNDARALSSLRRQDGRPMRALAEEWGCDASNATWIVDRLERRGLVMRTTPAADRRVKHVVLTARGAKTERRLMRDLERPPRELLALDRARLAALHDALASIPVPSPAAGRREPASRYGRPSPTGRG